MDTDKNHSIPYQSYKTKLPNITLHHLEWSGDAETSPAEKSPIIFIPGFIANARFAMKMGDVLAPAYRVLALDLRGRGESDKPQDTYGLDVHLHDLKNWLMAQKLHSRKVILMGHSFGAMLSLLFAAEYPEQVKKLILVDGGAIPGKAALEMFIAYHQNLVYEFESVDAYVDGYKSWPALQPWVKATEMLIRSNVEALPNGRARRVVPSYVVEAELKALSQEGRHNLQNLSNLYPKISMPVLLLRAGMGSYSKADQHLPEPVLETMSTGIPNFGVYDIPEAGHTSILTIPHSGRDNKLKEFLDR